MKRKTIVFLIVVGCVTLLSAGLLLMQIIQTSRPRVPASKETISVVTDDNYPPYVFRNSNGGLQGILIDQWALWSAQTGVQAKIYAMDWADALVGMQAGKYDVIDTAFYNEERDTWLDFAEPYATIDVPIFHNNKIGGITDAASLVGFEVAVKSGDSCITILQAAGVTNIVEYPSYEAVVEAAKRGDVNVFVADEPAALYFLYQKGIANDFSRSQTLYSGQFHRAVKQGDEKMLQLVSEGFATIPSDRLHVIDDKWFGREGTMLYLGYYIEYVLAGIAVVGMIILLVSHWNMRLRKEVKKKTDELRREKELLTITLQSIGDGVVATDVTGAITMLNPTARRMTRWGTTPSGSSSPRFCIWSTKKRESR
jgi:ABC-type amino acid transport substrate-binding protein